LQINPNQTAQQLVQNVLIGGGVTVSNITFTGNPAALGGFTGGATTNLGLNSGIILATGNATDAAGPNSSGSTSTSFNLGSDPQLAALITQSVNDAAAIEFDFVPVGDTLRFKYVFGSDEYPEFVNSYNDVFGFFVSGPNPSGGNYVNENIALIPGTNTAVTINNINNGTNNAGPCVNCQYYVNNVGGISVEYDGFTTVLTAEVLVTPCQTYHFKIAIGDAGDFSYDSGVFLEENSFSSTVVDIDQKYSIANTNDGIEGCNDIIIVTEIPKIQSTDYIVQIDSMWGTATNGVDFPLIADSIVILAGNLSDSLVITPFADGISEPTEDFHIIIRTSPCTTDTISFQILDYMPLAINSTSPDTLICEDSAFLRVNVINGVQPYIFDWTPDSSLSDSSISNPIAYPSQTTMYYITISDTTVCPIVSDSILVEVSPKPTADFSLSPIKGCEPLQVDFIDQSSAFVSNWDWNLGDGNTSQNSNPTNTYNSGQYSVNLIVTTDDACKDSISKTFEVFPLPEIKLSSDKSEYCFGETITLEVNGAENYLWSNNSTDSVLKITASELTSDFSVEGTDSNGCKDFKTITVNAFECFKLYVPSAFTPDGDGHNDVFMPQGEFKGVVDYNFIIFDRFGKKIFSTNSYQTGWNGEIDGRVYNGVYTYLIQVKIISGKEYRKAGTVTLIK